ncbi:MAG TPA: hypothetical protein VFW25_12765 [Silvibacterium sp.]|nr:hypothetical protein [Silvibacterium sp.]
MEPESAASARVEAFLTVPLYRAIYETYKGKTLPPTGGLESAFVNLGVAPKQKEKARQAFQRSARDAGFFAYGSTKLVIPVLPVAVGHGKAQAESEESVVPQTGEIGGGGNGGGDDTHHPLIDGLIRALPEAGKPWTLEARRKWLQAAAMNFDYVYADTETGNRSIRVSVITDKDSAN